MMKHGKSKAALILALGSPKDEPDDDDEGSGESDVDTKVEAAMEEFLAASKKGDAAGMAVAFQKAHEMCMDYGDGED